MTGCGMAEDPASAEMGKASLVQPFPKAWIWMTPPAVSIFHCSYEPPAPTSRSSEGLPFQRSYLAERGRRHPTLWTDTGLLCSGCFSSLNRHPQSVCLPPEPTYPDCTAHSEMRIGGRHLPEDAYRVSLTAYFRSSSTGASPELPWLHLCLTKRLSFQLHNR